ncbi:putative hydrolase of the HAD superfamily [Pseudochelatococcus lubricantis]|uniref:Hydrolase of the HAD superfamily n=1 Tax=Pseudochelatococcus lubricantis TaxID=1538102 RepID=A0ABX0V2K7_9HYPH|nr:pyrimidine 5'-nucleotidase [Pseudochelatococcus lubricantis]NIJ59362.1 putative hydrolase of the HAD superfamily [Pseudochelatococcus lubricantis]
MAYEENEARAALADPAAAGVASGDALPGHNDVFAHVETWIFDLDNTLYSHEAGLWPQVDTQITLYMCELFGLDAMSARALQKYYYHRYGTTLRGLMAEHAVDPQAFLDFAHDIDYSAVVRDERLRRAVANLPGRRFVFTNGSRAHAGAVVGRLGIADLFEDLFDIVDAAFVPKPEAVTYARFIERHGIDPTRAAMFEDLSANLAVPHGLGMQTVLVLPATPDPHREAHEQGRSAEAHIGHQTTDLAAFLHCAAGGVSQLSDTRPIYDVLQRTDGVRQR